MIYDEHEKNGEGVVGYVMEVSSHSSGITKNNFEFVSQGR
jgi:hypothetical protein